MVKKRDGIKKSVERRLRPIERPCDRPSALTTFSAVAEACALVNVGLSAVVKVKERENQKVMERRLQPTD
jgi:hypothetical protein